MIGAARITDEIKAPVRPTREKRQKARARSDFGSIA
jgi:hypothetical protein